MSLVVLAPGIQTLVQDLGRPGRCDIGVTPSGAFDRGALAAANRLVGNPPDAAGLEVLGGGLRLRAEQRVIVAVTGASGPLTRAGQPAEPHRSVVLDAGDELHLGTFTAGVRGYVAVAGGIALAPVLGSQSRDTLAQLGPEPIAAGDRLPLGPATAEAASTEAADADLGPEVTVAAIAGPRDDWFTAEALETLFSAAWQVSTHSSRIGIRLTGPELARAIADELESEPVVRGSIQVTHDGQPVILGPDHPVTGGYPVIAVVADADMDRLAQVRPGNRVRFARKSAHRGAPTGKIAP